MRLDAAVGFDRDEVTLDGITYDEMRPGCVLGEAPASRTWTPTGPRPSLCFPTFPRFCGQTFPEAKDKELALLVRRGVQRLDGRRVVRRVRRPAHPAASSSRCGTPSSRPPRCAATPRAACARCASPRSRRTSACRRSTPDHWDPFFAACDETGTVICMHIGSSSKMPSTSPDAPAAVGSTLTFANACLLARRLAVVAACFDRFPNLKIAYSEGQIGWIPYILDRADVVWEENRGWGGVADKVPEPPSELLPRARLRLLLRRRRTGCATSTQIGVDNVDLRDRLPALRLDLAQHPRRSAEEQMGDLDRRRRREDRARQRHQVAAPGQALSGWPRSPAQSRTGSRSFDSGSSRAHRELRRA